MRNSGKFGNIFIALLIAASLTIAGCGGGGGGTAEEPPPPMPTQEELCADAGNSWVGGECLTPAQVTFNTALAAINAATTAEDAQAAYDAVKDDITASAGEMLQAAVDARVDELATMARAEEQKMALTTAAGMIDTSDLSTADDIADANDDIAALQQALDEAVDVSDADKAMYQSQLDTAKTKVATAQTNLDTETRRTEQMGVLMTASGTLETALAALSGEPTQEQIDTVQTAVNELNAAIEAGADLTDAEKNSYTTAVANAESRIDQAKKTLMANNDREEKDRLAREKKADEEREAKEEEEADARAETGKLLHAALGPNMGGPTPLTNIAAPVLATTGLTIDAADGAGAIADGTDPPSVELKAGDSAGALGSWNGTDYARSTGTGSSKVTNEARVYTNKGPARSIPFTDAGNTIIAPGNPNAGSVELVNAGSTVQGIDLADVMAAAFEHSGRQTHQIPDNNVALKVRGTFKGAPGELLCTGDCTSTNDGKGGPSALGGTWHFKPDAGAMASLPDENYLYFGWWVSKDNDGEPTAASAFVGEFGDVDNAGTITDTANGVNLTGSATYAGKAVGKFAMSNPIDSTGNGGHFTADAELTAKFGAIAADNENGVTGTIDNFRLNDGTEDPGWSVSLNRSSAWGDDGLITGPTSDATVWSMNGNKADASGDWSGRMHDESPGNTDSTPPGDGSTIPTTVTGTFYSEFSSFGRLVGAFGANKQ